MYLIANNITAYRALVMPSGLGLAEPQIALDGRCMTGHGFSEIDITYGESQGCVFAEELPVDFVVPPTVQSTEEIINQKRQAYEGAVSQYLDSKASLRGYGNIVTASTRASLIGSLWQSEGLAYGLWMDRVWQRCYQILNAVLAGQRREPTFEEVVVELERDIPLVLPPPVVLPEL